jgi:hypothetical protein
MIFPTAHALLIGIGSYAHAPQLNLPITAAAANAVAAARTFDRHAPVSYHEAAYGRVV